MRVQRQHGIRGRRRARSAADGVFTRRSCGAANDCTDTAAVCGVSSRARGSCHRCHRCFAQHHEPDVTERLNTANKWTGTPETR